VLSTLFHFKMCLFTSAFVQLPPLGVLLLLSLIVHHICRPSTALLLLQDADALPPPILLDIMSFDPLHGVFVLYLQALSDCARRCALHWHSRHCAELQLPEIDESEISKFAYPEMVTSRIDSRNPSDSGRLNR
jgi:hypothetical protein